MLLLPLISRLWLSPATSTPAPWPCCLPLHLSGMASPLPCSSCSCCVNSLPSGSRQGSLPHLPQVFTQISPFQENYFDPLLNITTCPFTLSMSDTTHVTFFKTTLLSNKLDSQWTLLRTGKAEEDFCKSTVFCKFQMSHLTSASLHTKTVCGYGIQTLIFRLACKTG